jgi:3-oxoacyl-[acyl-carrier-protein] synthase-3
MSVVSEILSVGMCVPEKILTNHDLSKFMETSDEWIVQRTGIKTRHWVDAQTTTSDLALKACEEALEKANVAKSEIDMIVLATITPDHDFPGTSCFLQAKLGLSQIPCLDIRQACSGFIYALSIADQFIKSEQYKTILVVGAEIHSKGLDRTTRGRDISVLFGDGAGACVLRAAPKQTSSSGTLSTQSQIYSTHLFTDGTHARELWLPGPGMGLGSEDRINHQMIDELKHFAYMNGKKVFTHAVKRMAECLLLALDKNQVKLEDVDVFLFHQANLRINEYLANELKIPPHKVFNTIQDYGNTTAATIPIGMYEAQKAGLLKKGSLVASAVFGAGFTWASALYRW